MTTPPRPVPLRLTALCLALLTAFGFARAQSSSTEAEASLGVGVLSADTANRAQYGQYNGLRTSGKAVGLLGFDYFKRDAEAATTLQFQGVNLALEIRELSLAWRKQGDWKFRADYGEMVRYDPNTVRTSLLGAGTTAPQVLPQAIGSGSDLNLRTRRTGLGVSVWKSLGTDINLEVSLKTEDKTGSRLFGSGISCPSPVAPGCRGTTGANVGSAVLLLPEPINANHTQVEARLSYAGERLRLSGGYYGSFYNNRFSTLSPQVPDSLNNPLGRLLPLNTGLQALLNLPLALPPDNQAHHLDLTGNYVVSPVTALNFKLAYAQALQHQDFAAAGLTGAPAGTSNLGGRIDTTLAQVGVSSRPWPKVSLQGDLRYEDKDDRTPIALYNLEGNATYTNQRLPSTRTRARLQASYQFSRAYRGTLGADYEAIDRGAFTATSAVAGISALRQKTDETGVRAELRGTLTETLGGAFTVESTRREGSNWLKPNSGVGVTEVSDPNDPATGFGAAAIFSPTLANRQRDKLKLRADWQPTESLSLQFSAEDGKDHYTVSSDQGLHDSGTRQFGVDGSYVLSEKWNLNGYLSQGTQTLHQSRAAGYILSFKNTNTNLGLGVTGKLTDKIEVGGGLSWVDDKDVYAQSLDGFAPPESVALLAATGGLPDVTFRQATLKLFAKYEITKGSSARIDLLHQQSRVNDWTWGYNGVPYAYSDGSTVWQKPNQHVTLVAVSYLYQWR